ncbi:MAG: glycoside hydrolase family 3 C-terminal domain-containing protein [Steroidobacteraceae bacterium]
MTLEQKASQLVDNSAAIPELGIPAYSWWNEALHGIASAGIATVFPQAIGLAASFDTALVESVATAIGREGRAKHQLATASGKSGIPFHGLTFYSPNINIFRDPRWGRGQETYGEDPYLTGKMGVAFITGMQGKHPHYLQVGATAKHFAVHSGPERGRHAFDAQVSPHDLEDTYLPAFREAVIDGRVAAVMASYNRINGIPACANEFLLRERLQGSWGFTGQIVSDCDGVRLIDEQHHYRDGQPAAYAAALRAGLTSVLDFMFGRDYSNILKAVEQGLISESDLDAPLQANLSIRFRLGMFDAPAIAPQPQVATTALDSPEHRALALNSARKSMVLLKNNGILPIADHVRKIAVIGPLADSLRVLLGSYHGTPSAATTMLEGLKKQFANCEIVFEPGTAFLRDPAIVPSQYLSTASGATGLDVGFYLGNEPVGEPILQRIDPTLVYDGTATTRPASVPENSPVRWSGVLTPDVSGEFDIGVSGNSIRLYLDGRLLIDDSGPHAPRATLARIKLERNRRYSIAIELLPGLEQHCKLIWLPIPFDALDKAITAARDAELVIAAVGITAELENEEIKTDVPGFEGGDRTDLGMPAIEVELLQQVKATGKPLIVVLMSGSPISDHWSAEHADAIVQAWYPGEEGGTAIAETLAGLNNPAGRLPITIYKGVEQLPDFTDYDMSNRTYRYFKDEPLYPFGFGLSYSRFSYSQLKLDYYSLSAGETLRVTATVSNISTLDGDEVAQLYLCFPALPGAPLRALRGFSRLHLQAGQSREVNFVLNARDLSHVTIDGNRIVGAGHYRLCVGGGQPGTTVAIVEQGFQIRGQHALPK